MFSLIVLKIFLLHLLTISTNGKYYNELIENNICQGNNFNTNIELTIKDDGKLLKQSNLSARINESNKKFLNSSTNYLFGNLNVCHEDKKNNFPNILIVLLANKPVPFFTEYLENILKINYPKDKIDLFLHCTTPYHDELLEKFISNNGQYYRSFKLLVSSVVEAEEIEEAWKFAVEDVQGKLIDYVFVVDNEVQIDNENILTELIAFNKSFIAPILTQQNHLISNFWGTLTKASSYVRSEDYSNIVKGSLRGIWNASCVTSCYLIKRNAFHNIKFSNFAQDAEISLCNEMREKDVQMNIVNMKNYGHLMNTDEYNITLTNPDFFEYFTNPKDWEKRYIHPDYSKQLAPDFKHLEPCPDVFWFPIVTEIFCNELIGIAENFGQWTGGTYQSDSVISDPVPTSDIYMYQIGLQEVWLAFLDDYVRPLQENVYIGYYHHPPRSLVNFIVRYKPEEQSFLRPHLDTSTYTINIALNTPLLDYVGGGCRFVRYNCSVTDTKKGWMLMHPGQLTHLHEGLRVTNGTRYIMVSFVDP